MDTELRSFSRSLDESGSPFYSAPGWTPDETWKHARDRMAELVVELGAQDSEQIVVSPQRLQGDHRRIFGGLFPEDAGRLRWKHRGRWETAARLYAKVLRIHPFVDGNLRAAYVTLQAALLRLGLVGIEFADHRAHDEALVRALAPGGRRQSYEPLAELIAGLIPRG